MWYFLDVCRVMLSGSEGKLVLKELYSFYTRQVKEKVYGLSDPHRCASGCMSGWLID